MIGMLGSCSTCRFASLSEEINGNDRLVMGKNVLRPVLASFGLLAQQSDFSSLEPARQASRGRGEEKLASEPNVPFNATVLLWSYDFSFSYDVVPWS